MSKVVVVVVGMGSCGPMTGPGSNGDNKDGLLCLGTSQPRYEFWKKTEDVFRISNYEVLYLLSFEAFPAYEFHFN
ncbi:hypothetical protein MUK42_12237 [Musa troglodytarum]|uniref:Uncharacterized protein n=1 Tax=Musa troglodytarum TaxID=320322 RepID=A0A9E7GHB1_9LILI|nr:hypothetical protein MUK42_12237 [Musa troglodytarum]URE14815.1 hypothetical protein MUK42_12237 [Musa troglodytarum]